MTNPYIFELNGLNVTVYAENKEKATEIFNQKINEYNLRIRNEVIDEFVEHITLPIVTEEDINELVKGIINNDKSN